MKKIVTLGIALSNTHKERLEAIGKLEILERPISVEDFLNKSKDASAIYS